ncbi:toll/interleukin-1 receptor domain-containing protein [Coleofasciculus sp. G2-EDA-02]|uniref:toll/interleukin-1 receptor domain-containing protein n=1 Tax=Coleofasciculus sp. G2-EDA-02 TaxID=3069529 RepID=UPI003300F3FC
MNELNKQPQFDVFMAHNSKDKPQVLEIAEQLKQRGLKPWVDIEQIPPGESFQKVIQQAIPNVKSAAIFFGLVGTGNWQEEEISVIISQSRNANIPVIPVLLPGVNKVPDDLLFLSQRNWVDFVSSLDDIKALDLLEWGITRKKPGAAGENQTTSPSSSSTGQSAENELQKKPRFVALELLERLRPPQFKKVLFYYESVDEYDFPDNASQSEKAQEFVRLAVAQEGESLSKLLNTIYKVAPYLKK